jgi:hypothetical protein
MFVKRGANLAHIGRVRNKTWSLENIHVYGLGIQAYVHLCIHICTAFMYFLHVNAHLHEHEHI